MTHVYNRCRWFHDYTHLEYGYTFKQNFADRSANMLTYMVYLYMLHCRDISLFRSSISAFGCLVFFYITTILEASVLNISKKAWLADLHLSLYNVLCKRIQYHLIWLFWLAGQRPLSLSYWIQCSKDSKWSLLQNGNSWRPQRAIIYGV